MSIWQDIGSLIGDVQSLKDGIVSEITSDAQQIGNTISGASQEIKNSASSAKDTVNDVVQELGYDLNLNDSAKENNS